MLYLIPAKQSTTENPLEKYKNSRN